MPDSLREQALFQAIFNHLADAVLVLDGANTIMLCSPAVTRVFGYAPEELIGKPMSALYANAEEYQRVRTLKARLREQTEGNAEPLVVRFHRKSGEEFPAEVVISVLRDQQGLFIGFVLLNRDISQQVVQDEALRKSQRMEAIGQLTGGIAHDFNNLLTIITGNHELLEMELADPEQQDLLARANDAALMGARLTSRLLTFARRRRLEPVVLDLNEQVLGMAELLRRTLGETIALGTLLAPRLWSMRADPSEIENAVLNLAINARDAMPAGGKLVIETRNAVLDEATLASEVGVAPGDYVRLAVSDTGVGMPPDVLARVFEPFFTTKEPGKGTGLGLSVIYGFVKQSGGHVTIYSEEGKGTTVNLYLPRAAATAGATAAERRRRSPATATGETILLVEDNAEVRSVTARRLSNLGYSVIEADNAAAAIERLGAGRKHRSRVQRRGDAGRNVGLRSRALGARARADSAGPADVGLRRGRRPRRRDAAPGRGGPAQALFGRRPRARPAQVARARLGSARTKSREAAIADLSCRLRVMDKMQADSVTAPCARLCGSSG